MWTSPLPNAPEQPGPIAPPTRPEPPLPGTPPTIPPDSSPSPKPVPGGLPPTGPADQRVEPLASFTSKEFQIMRTVLHSTFALALLFGSAACSHTARGVVQDTKDNASAV